MPTSPTKRTLDYLRGQGATCQVVEHWNAFAKRRIDLFGVIDIVALMGKKIVGIQCTTGTNHSSRLDKSIKEPKLWRWLHSGGRFIIISWRQSSEGKWIMRQQEVTYAGQPKNTDSIHQNRRRK